jgi:hypothetical protein
MQTFSEVEAGKALTRLARFKLRDTRIKPTDVCLYAWLAAEAARENVNPVQLTISDMFFGFTASGDGKEEEICRVGMSLNTIKSCLENLEDNGFIATDRTASTRGQKINVQIVLEA